MKNNNLYMARCLELAKKGAGYVSPNPMVGCVIVYENKIIGEGYHQKYGDHHAEVNAIKSVKEENLLSKSTLYVNLEPCAHFGNTPPCCEYIVSKKITKVVIGSKDISKKVNGLGIKFLKEHNVKVKLDVLSKQCIDLNKRFFNFQKNKIPYIILKWAETKDGFIDVIREKKNKGINWITNESTKLLVHQWRSEEDAILVGRKTVENDNPKLTVRKVDGKNPVRIVLDPTLKLKTSFNVFDSSSKTIVVNQSTDKEFKNLQYLKTSDKYMIDELLKYLFTQNITSIIVEGGKHTLNSFIEKNYWNEARVIVGDTIFNKGLKSPSLNKDWSIKKDLEKDVLYTYFND